MANPQKKTKGRKFWLTVWVLVVSFASCTIALYLGRLTGSDYVNFLQWTVPLGISAHHAANVAQKVLQKPERTNAVTEDSGGP